MEDAPPAPPLVPPKLPRLAPWRVTGLLVILAIPVSAAIARGVTGDNDMVEPILRVAFVYLVLMLGFRFLGKRELGQLSQFELVTLMLIPEIVSPAMNMNDETMTGAMVGICTLFVLVTVTSLLTYLFPGANAAFAGRPTVLVRHGRLLMDALNRERIATEEVYAAMHQAGLERIEDVKWCILEAEGRMAFIAWGDKGAGGGPEPSMLA